MSLHTETDWIQKQKQLLSQIDTMRRKGVADDAIAAEIIKEIAALDLEIAASVDDHPELDELAEIAHTLRPWRPTQTAKVANRVADIPDKVLIKVAGIMRIPEANQMRFYRAVRDNLNHAESEARHTKIALAAKDSDGRRCAEDLILALERINYDTESQLQNWDGAVNYWVLRADF